MTTLNEVPNIDIFKAMVCQVIRKNSSVEDQEKIINSKMSRMVKRGIISLYHRKLIHEYFLGETNKSGQW